MSELINNSDKRKDLLKNMMHQLNRGENPEVVREHLTRVMGEVPYDTVVAAEQELLDEGMPFTEMLKMCDIHAAALKGQIDLTASKQAPPGHPVHTFIEENRALLTETTALKNLLSQINSAADPDALKSLVMQIRMRLNNLSDIDKHYKRKENLVFPFLEKHGITGPPKVMWGKHDETRRLLSQAIATLAADPESDKASMLLAADQKIKPAITSIEDMISKEENILFPMCMDTLSNSEWYQAYSQSLEVGFCLYDPRVEWIPEGVERQSETHADSGRIQFPTGSFTPAELEGILNSLPFDLTFVDADDTVRYFSAGRDRIFERNRAVLGRKVQLCHPPSSAWIVQRILDDFRSGGEDRAPFWINMNGKFIHIEYFAVRGKDGKYMGTLEVTQDLTEKKELSGEQRLLNYIKDWQSGPAK
jgi:hypothetical protein